eukprot:4939104-Amphidinium_carterae.1
MPSCPGGSGSAGACSDNYYAPKADHSLNAVGRRQVEVTSNVALLYSESVCLSNHEQCFKQWTRT